MLRTWLSTLWRHLPDGTSRSQPLNRKGRSLPLALEILDDRTTPSTLQVATSFDLPLSGQSWWTLPTNSRTLRAAIAQANSDARFGISDTIYLPGITSIWLQYGLGQLELNGTGGTITINGEGAIIDGLNSSRVFQVDPGVQAVLNNLTIQHGWTYAAGSAGWGAGILNYGTLTLNSDVVQDNYSYYGGAVFNDGSLTVDPTIQNGGLTVTPLTQFLGNRAVYGGGIYNQGYANMNNVIVAENSANLDGGGVGNTNLFIVTNSKFYSNAAELWGGGIFNESGTATVANSYFGPGGGYRYGNSALYGAAIFNSSCTTPVIANGVVTSAGLVVTNGTIITGNEATYGGGIYNEGTTGVSGSFFSGNYATYGGGGIATTDWLYVIGSSFSGNRAGSVGGNIWTESGTMIIVDSNL
jgi:hypothetical protein